MLEKAITELLFSQSITALSVGGVHHNVISEGGNYPALSYRVIASRPDHTIDQTGPRKAAFEVQVVGDDLAKIGALTAVIQNLLPSFRGVFGGVQIGGIVETEETPTFDSGSGIHRRILNFNISYKG